jgi:hypothetical protein
MRKMFVMGMINREYSSDSSEVLEINGKVADGSDEKALKDPSHIK